VTFVHGLFEDGIAAELVEALAIGFIDRLVENVFAQDLSQISPCRLKKNNNNNILHTHKFT
jgi:hypothetical protein